MGRSCFLLLLSLFSFTGSSFGAAPSKITGLIQNGPVTLVTIPVSWTAPNNGGSPILYYTLYYMLVLNSGEFGNPMWRGIVIYDTHATLSGTYIAPSHYHLIKVTATNAHGTSPDSDIISISTASGNTVPAVPEPPVVELISNNKVVLSWSPPAFDGGIAIDHYGLFITQDGISVSYVCYVLSNVFSCSADSLSPNTLYKFSVAAFNSIGGSYRSYATEVTTLQGLPSPCSPFMSPTYRVWDLGSLGVIHNVASSLTVSFCETFSGKCNSASSVCTNGKSLGKQTTRSISPLNHTSISVSYYQGDSCVVNGVPTPSSVSITILCSSASVTTLGPLSYSSSNPCSGVLVIYAANSVCGQVFIPPPNPIGTINVLTVTAVSIQISWTAPPGASYYVVHIKKSGDSSYTSFTTSNTVYTFTGLQGGLTYLVKVVAWNSAGQSPPESDKSITTTIVCVPTVEINKATFGSLNVLWNKFKPTITPSGVQMLAAFESSIVAAWSSNKTCTSALTTGFYYRLNFTAAGNTDGLSLAIQPLSNNVIGDSGSNHGIQGGNITTAFGIKSNVYWGMVQVYTAKNGVVSTPEHQGINYPQTTPVVVEIWHSKAPKISYGRVTTKLNTYNFNFSLDLSPIFAGYSHAFVGVTGATGGSSANVTLHEFIYSTCLLHVTINAFTYSELAIVWNNVFKPIPTSNGIQMTTAITNIASAIWYPKRICTSAVITSFYARMDISATANTDGFSFVIQPLSPTVIGGFGEFMGVEKGNITTGFAVEISFHLNDISFFTALNGVTSKYSVAKAALPLNKQLIFELWYNGPTTQLSYGRITAPGQMSASFSFTYNLASLFSKYQEVYIGATASTGGSYASATLHQLSFSKTGLNLPPFDSWISGNV